MILKNPTNQILIAIIALTALFCIVCTLNSCNPKVPNTPNVTETVDTTVILEPTDTIKPERRYCQPKLDSLIKAVNKEVKDNEQSESFGLFKARGKSSALLGFKRRSANNCVNEVAAKQHIDLTKAISVTAKKRWNAKKNELYVVIGKTKETLTDNDIRDLRLLHLRYEQARSQHTYAVTLYSKLQ